MCRGSHRSDVGAFASLQSTYGELDVERDHLDGSGWFTTDPFEISHQFGGQWCTTDYEAGDVVLFGWRLVHMSTTNETDKVRVSCDVRWQPAGDAVDPRYVGDIDIDDFVVSGAWNSEDSEDVNEAVNEAATEAGNEVENEVEYEVENEVGKEGAEVSVTIEELKEQWGLDGYVQVDDTGDEAR